MKPIYETLHGLIKKKHQGIDFEYKEREYNYFSSDPTLRLFCYLEDNGFNVYKIYDSVVIYNYKQVNTNCYIWESNDVNKSFELFCKFLNEHKYNTILLKEIIFRIFNDIYKPNNLYIGPLIEFIGIRE